VRIFLGSCYSGRIGKPGVHLFRNLVKFRVLPRAEIIGRFITGVSPFFMLPAIWGNWKIPHRLLAADLMVTGIAGIDRTGGRGGSSLTLVEKGHPALPARGIQQPGHEQPPESGTPLRHTAAHQA